jgi:transposase
VWIPPGEVRDQRDLPRTRMVLVRQRTQLKNRIHATLAKYALHDVEVSDLFGVRDRALLRPRLSLLLPHTAYATEQLLAQIEGLDRGVRGFEQRIQAVFKPTPAIQRLLTLPGVGLTLAVVIALEVGDVTRFAIPRSWPGMLARRRASTPAAGRPALGRPGRTSTATSNGRSSKRRTRSGLRAGAPRAATSVASTSGWRGARTTRKPSGRWPGIWPKRRIGC